MVDDRLDDDSELQAGLLPGRRHLADSVHHPRLGAKPPSEPQVPSRCLRAAFGNAVCVLTSEWQSVIIHRMGKLIALTLMAGPAFAADVTGAWTATMKLNYGGGSATFVFTQTGEQLKGSYKGALGEAPVAGSVKGTHVEWEFDHARLGKIRFSGSVKDSNTIEGSAKYGQFVSGTFVAQRK